MVNFNQLLVIPYNKGIYIDVSVMDLPYFTNVYIDTISIDTQNTFQTSGPSTTPVYTATIGGNQKNVQLTIADTSILVSKIEGTMFFVYVTVKGTPSSDTPCGLDDTTSLAVAVDSYSIYRTGINYLQDLYVAGEVDREFIDFILRYKAFELCLKTRDFPLAITYWNRFWSNLPTSSLSKCNCNG